MDSLSFDEKVILTLYQKFYAEEYPAPANARQIGEPERMTDEHVKAQKMCYLLNLSGICVGGFNYTWNTYGPYSPGLQAELRELDRKHDLVRDYYDLRLSDAVIFSDEDENSLFWSSDQESIKQLVDALEIPEDGAAVRDWMELLGSMAYISQNVFPHGQFAWVNEELVSRKHQYNDEEANKKAWNILLGAHLLSTRTVQTT